MPKSGISRNCGHILRAGRQIYVLVAMAMRRSATADRSQHELPPHAGMAPLRKASHSRKELSI